MKLLGILKEKFEKAETIEEKKKVLAEVGIELTDDEMESAVGGLSEAEQMFEEIARNDERILHTLPEHTHQNSNTYTQGAQAAISKAEQVMRSVARGQM